MHSRSGRTHTARTRWHTMSVVPTALAVGFAGSAMVDTWPVQYSHSEPPSVAPPTVVDVCSCNHRKPSIKVARRSGRALRPAAEPYHDGVVVLVRRLRVIASGAHSCACRQGTRVSDGDMEGGRAAATPVRSATRRCSCAASSTSTVTVEGTQRDRQSHRARGMRGGSEASERTKRAVGARVAVLAVARVCSRRIEVRCNRATINRTSTQPLCRPRTHVRGHHVRTQGREGGHVGASPHATATRFPTLKLTVRHAKRCRGRASRGMARAQGRDADAAAAAVAVLHARVCTTRRRRHVTGTAPHRITSHRVTSTVHTRHGRGARRVQQRRTYIARTRSRRVRRSTRTCPWSSRRGRRRSTSCSRRAQWRHPWRPTAARRGTTLRRRRTARSDECATVAKSDDVTRRDAPMEQSGPS